MKLVSDWDRRKARTNLADHRVTFDETKTGFNDPLLLTFPNDPHSETEERFISIGYSSKQRLLLVIHRARDSRRGTGTDYQLPQGYSDGAKDL